MWHVCARRVENAGKARGRCALAAGNMCGGCGKARVRRGRCVEDAGRCVYGALRRDLAPGPPSARCRVTPACLRLKTLSCSLDWQTVTKPL